MAERLPPRLAVRVFELRHLHPSEHRFVRNADSFRSFVDVALNEQSGDRFFLLAAEFCAVPFHLHSPTDNVFQRTVPRFRSLRSSRRRIVLLPFATGVMDVMTEW